MDELNWQELQSTGSINTAGGIDHLVPAKPCQETQQEPETVLGTAFSDTKQWQEGRCRVLKS